MPGSFGGLNMMGNALRVFQRALDVTGHNISNVNTTGYSRQRISLGANQANTYYGVHPYQVGNGVNVQSVMRVHNALLDSRLNSATSDMGAYQSLATNLKQIESIFPEPSESGISDALGKFFDAWSALSTNPGDAAAKLQVRSAGQTLTQRVSTAFSELETQGQQTQAAITDSFDQIDSLSSKIASLNKEIAEKKAAGGEPNDLLDARDQAVNELSGYINVQTQEQANGMITVYAGQIDLVTGPSSNTIPRTYDASAQTLSNGTNSYPVASGSLSGLMQGLQKIQSYKGQLDLFANTMRTQVNAVHMSGKLSDGTSGIAFFNDADPQTGAADFALSDAVNTSADNIVSGSTGAAGDGTLALSLSKIRDSSITALGGKTFGSYYTDFVGSIGRDVDAYSGAVDTQSAVLQQVDQQKQSEVGVNLDEEMTNLMQYQRSYQAAARALSVLDQVTDDLVNLIK